MEIVQLGTRMHVSLPRVKGSLNKLDELEVWRMNRYITLGLYVQNGLMQVGKTGDVHVYQRNTSAECGGGGAKF